MIRYLAGSASGASAQQKQTLNHVSRIAMGNASYSVTHPSVSSNISDDFGHKALLHHDCWQAAHNLMLVCDRLHVVPRSAVQSGVWSTCAEIFCAGAQVEVAEGVPAYPLDPNYLAGYPVTEPIVSAVHTQPVLALYPPPSNPVQLANPFRVHLSEDPSQHVQQLLHSASQAVHNFRTEGFQAYEWQAQQQPISTMQVPCLTIQSSPRLHKWPHATCAPPFAA